MANQHARPRPQLYAAAISPVDADHRPGGRRFASFCKDLLARGCDGIALFGTTGEGPSFSVDERKRGLQRLLSAGVPANRIIVGTGCAALADTIELTRHAADQGCDRVLVVPPFYFKDLDDESVIESYTRLIRATEGTGASIILYNIPSLTAVPVSLRAVMELHAAFGERIAAVKDSSADWPYTSSLLAAETGLPIFVGNEPDLSRSLAAGAAGSISGLANLVPELLRALLDADDDSMRVHLQDRVDHIAACFDNQAFVPALKGVVSVVTAQPDLRRVRTPLRPISDTGMEKLVADITTAAGEAWLRRTNQAAE